MTIDNANVTLIWNAFRVLKGSFFTVVVPVAIHSLEPLPFAPQKKTRPRGFSEAKGRNLIKLFIKKETIIYYKNWFYVINQHKSGCRGNLTKYSTFEMSERYKYRYAFNTILHNFIYNQCEIWAKIKSFTVKLYMYLHYVFYICTGNTF